MANENTNVVLNEELYENLMSNSMQSIKNLKAEQTECLSKISIQKGVLKNLLHQLIELKTNIREIRRTLKNEKRHLKLVKKNLKLAKNSIVELNTNFISEEEISINPREYTLKKR